MQRTKHVHLDFIKHQIGDDQSVIDEMLSSFEDVLDDFREGMKCSLRNQEPKNMRLHLHKIKPSLKMFDASPMLSKVLDIEKNCDRNVDFDRLRSMYASIESILPEMFEEIRKLRSKDVL